MKRLATLLLAAAFFLAGCDAIPFLQADNGQGAPSGALMFADDFQDTSGGWQIWTEPSGSAVIYSDGGLRITVAETQFDYWSRPTKRYGDAEVEVQAAKLGGPDDNDFGVMCRYQDKDHFYAMLISSDGYAGILKVKDGNYQIISGDSMVYHAAIKQGDASNKVVGVCSGATLRLEVNDELVVETEDAEYASGEVGVIAGTADTPGTDILFTQFRVYRP